MSGIHMHAKAKTAQRLEYPTGAPSRRFVVEVTERRDGALLSDPTHRFLVDPLDDVHVPCSDPTCRRGGLRLGPLMRAAVREHETEQLLIEMCPGWVRVANKKRARAKCYGMFFIRICRA